MIYHFVDVALLQFFVVSDHYVGGLFRVRQLPASVTRKHSPNSPLQGQYS